MDTNTRLARIEAARIVATEQITKAVAHHGVSPERARSAARAAMDGASFDFQGALLTSEIERLTADAVASLRPAATPNAPKGLLDQSNDELVKAAGPGPGAVGQTSGY